MNSRIFFELESGVINLSQVICIGNIDKDGALIVMSNGERMYATADEMRRFFHLDVFVLEKEPIE